MGRNQTGPTPDFTMEDLLAQSQQPVSEKNAWTTAEIAEATNIPERSILRYLKKHPDIQHTTKTAILTQDIREVPAYYIEGVESLEDMIEALDMSLPNPQLSTVPELAEQLDIPRRTLRRKIKQGIEAGTIEEAGTKYHTGAGGRRYRVIGYRPTSPDMEIEELL